MQVLRESWLTVKEIPFHRLTRQEIIDEPSMPKLDARISPLEKWLKTIGEVYQSLEPQKCSALQKRVTIIAEHTKDEFLTFFEDEPAIFRLGVFFGAYGALFLKEKNCFQSARLLCGRIKELELQMEAKAEDSAIERTICAIATLYEKFIISLTANSS